MTLQAQSSRVAFAAMCRSVGQFARRAGLPAELSAEMPLNDCPKLTDEVFRRCVAAAEHPADGLLSQIFTLAQWGAAGSHLATGSASRQSDGQLWSLFETIRLDSKAVVAPQKRKPLAALSVEALFPQEALKHTGSAYADLWKAFVQDGEVIPPALRDAWPLWLDAFDTLCLTYAQAIPTSVDRCVRADVSLYDHAKASAALATALWRWSEDVGLCQKDESSREAALRDEQAFLLVQGDFFGIQNFIFSGASETNRKAAKMLRGRSFYVSLLTEACALRVLDALDLPPTSQIMNAAGKFLIVAPNTEDVRAKVASLRTEIESWFVRHTCAEAGIGLAVQPAALKDFSESAFPNLMKGLFEQLELAKLRRFDLCGATPVPVVLDVTYPFGACAWQGRWPADRAESGGLASCAVSRDQIRIGEALLANDLLVLATQTPGVELPHGVTALELPVLGCSVYFTKPSCLEGLIRALPKGAVRRVWDFSMPKDAGEVLWRGFARRAINGYVPRVDDVINVSTVSSDPRFAGLDEDDIGRGGVLPFDWIARSDLSVDEQGRLQGVDAICCLKGDVDHLGRIFQEGLRDKTTGRGASFAKMAALSREVNAFFAVVAPWLCRTQFPSVYTVFAGGDDFTFIGPIHQTQRFAETLREAFERFVAKNPEVHFSVGMTVVKSGAPVGRFAEQAEEALGAAKAVGRNRVTIFGRTVDWTDWKRLRDVEAKFEELREACGLSTAYLYQLFNALELAERRNDPRAAIWRSRLFYQTTRFVTEAFRRRNLSGDPQARITQMLQAFCGSLEAHRGDLRIPLTNLFYRIRTRRG